MPKQLLYRAGQIVNNSLKLISFTLCCPNGRNTQYWTCECLHCGDEVKQYAWKLKKYKHKCLKIYQRSPDDAILREWTDTVVNFLDGMIDKKPVIPVKFRKAWAQAKYNIEDRQKYELQRMVNNTSDDDEWM